MVAGSEKAATLDVTALPLFVGVPPVFPLKRSFAAEIGFEKSTKSRSPMTETSTPYALFSFTRVETMVDSTTTCIGGVSISASNFATAATCSGKSFTTSMPSYAQLSLPPSALEGWKPSETVPTNDNSPPSESSGFTKSAASFALRFCNAKLRLSRRSSRS